MSREPSERARLALAGLLLLTLVLVLYAPTVRHDFVRFDDFEYIVENEMVRQGLTLDGLRWAFTTFHQSNWHPLTWLSHMLDCELFGVDAAGGHHVVSALLHGASAWILLLALARMTGAFWPSLLVAALFAVHPLRVESVAWAAERKDVLSGLFWMLGLLAYGTYARRPSVPRYLAVVLCLGLGLLAKPMLVTLPCVLLLLDLWPLERWRAGARLRLVLEKLPLLALAGAAGAATVVAQRAGGAVQDLALLSLGERVANAALAYAAYLGKTFWPSDLAFYYPHPGMLPVDPRWALFYPAAAVALALLLLSGLVLGAARRRPYLLVGWLWYLGTLLPVIGVLQVGNQAMADRYAYLPLVGIYVALVWAVRDAAVARDWPRQPLAAAATLVVLALAVTTWNQVRVWRDSRSLFEHALRVTRHNYIAHTGLGNVLVREGHLAGAVEQYRMALRLRPELVEARNNLGSVLARLGNHAAAVEQYRRAIELRPQYAMAHYNLGLSLAALGDVEGAREHLARARELDPGLAAPQPRPEELPVPRTPPPSTGRDASGTG